MWSLLNQWRCKLAFWLAYCGHPKGLGVGMFLSPDTTSLIRHRRRNSPKLVVPRRSHLIYHQQTVDHLAAENCLRSLMPQIPAEDEVLFLDIGGTYGASALGKMGDHEWKSYAAAKASLPEQQSYTFGLNLGMRMLKGEQLLVWRTDYVYPPDMLRDYQKQMEGREFCSPYEVLVGNPEVDSQFVEKHWEKVLPFNADFWRERSKRVSLYETQDPALFGISKKLWEKIGGLNHELWGYGWQFAEFAARVRILCDAGNLVYFQGTPPLHQTHSGTLMHHAPGKAGEAQTGVDRFSSFLGGPEAYWLYRCKQNLKPLDPER
ncbi:hypothetical protein EBX31_04770 [bacterium]|nr:hypothetical protein [bacterium]